MSHTDAEFYDRHGFCRTDCAECLRLDQEELAAGVTPEMVVEQAMAMVNASLVADGLEPATRDEVAQIKEVSEAHRQQALLSMRPGHASGHGCSCGWHSHEQSYDEHLSEKLNEVTRKDTT